MPDAILLHKLFGEAYSEAAQQSIAVNGFLKCGIDPIDRHVFKDHDFLAADTTDVALAEPVTQQNEAHKENETPEREQSPSVLQDALEEILAMTPPLLDSQAGTLMSPIVHPQPSTITSPMLDPQPNTITSAMLDPQPSTITSPMLDPQPSTITSPMLDPQPSTSFAVMPRDLFPIPKALPKTKKINRKRGGHFARPSLTYDHLIPAAPGWNSTLKNDIRRCTSGLEAGEQLLLVIHQINAVIATILTSLDILNIIRI
ncbi:hypothetical protein HW555_003917 [Spodoptera exigua]|uniref:Uncharacterized protein n=1 Tax=Spodoptera exigua TaxID=7107 RepID=A0A835GL87_SPOEX|nr:hypothetical protein HW555_003917 [Spodoptera exigua]